MLILTLLVAGLFLAYANGANDNFKVVATVYGSDTLRYRQALWLATAAQLAGSLLSPFLAAVLVKAFSGKGLVPAELVTNPQFVLSVAFGAAVLVIISTRFGVPVSTTHALIGGLIGAGLAFAPSEIAWSNLGSKYFMPLLISPLLALGAAALLYPIASRARRWMGIEATSCLCLEEGDDLETVAQGGEAVALCEGTMALPAIRGGTAETCIYEGRVFGVSAQKIADTVHMGSAFSLGFARGLNDTAKVLGVIWVAQGMGVRMEWLLPAVAGMMALGGLLHSRRLAETMGHKITSMNTGQGLVSNGVASTLVIGASLLGSPVSTTHVSTGSIFGIGLWTGTANWRLVGGILVAWVATLPLGAAFAYLIASGFRLL